MSSLTRFSRDINKAFIFSKPWITRMAMTKGFIRWWRIEKTGVPVNRASLLFPLFRGFCLSINSSGSRQNGKLCQILHCPAQKTFCGN